MTTEPIEAETIPETQAVAVRQSSEIAASGTQAAPVVTAAQAKIEAVAALTMAAYQRAATLELTPEETLALQADFPDEAFQPGAAGKEHLIYIEHAYLRDRFNSVFGMGKWAIVPRNRWAEAFRTAKGEEASRVYVEAMLVVRGCFVGEAVGAMEYYPHNASQNYGDAVEGAKTASFRRCAKEFGVGLQAWKKEFCEGWWKRHWAKKKSGKPADPVPTAPSPQPKPAVVPTPDLPKPAPCATEEQKARFLKAMEPARELAQEFFTKLDWLLPTEALEDLDLRYVPSTVREMKILQERLTEFGNGEQAGKPYEPHWGTEAKPLPQPVPRPAKPPQPKDDEAWRDVIIPVPPKGMSRDQYLKAPQTIGQLFDLRHGNDEEAQAARQRLWGFVNHYEAKPWVGKDGKERPPSATDVAFRASLDAFQAWFERNHPDEKL